MNRGIDIKNLTTQAIIAALYVVLTWTLPEFSYGPIQFRIAEVLTLFAFYNHRYIFGLTLACAIANIMSPFGAIDIVMGAFASFVALYLMTKVKSIWIASLMPALSSPIVALVIKFVAKDSKTFWIIAGQLIVSEIIIVTVIGVPIMRIIMKNKQIKEYIIK